MPFRNLPGAKLTQYKKGEVLLASGQRLTHLFYLVEGIVGREIITENGNETIVTIKTTETPVDALVGLILLYRDSDISNSTFVAKTDCTCYLIPRESYVQVANQNPELLLSTIRLMTRETKRLTELYTSKREGDAASRLCALLLSQCQEQGGRYRVPIHWNNLEIAKYLGIHSVTVSRILKILKQNGCLYRSGQGLVLSDPDKIAAYAEHREHLNYR